MKRIVLLYADTGGGHRSAAEAIASGLHMQYGDTYRVSLLNAIAHLTFPYNQMEKSYPTVVNGPRYLHRWLYYATNSRRRSWVVRAILRASGLKMAQVVLRDHPADVYVSCSPMYSQTIPWHMQRMGSTAQFVAVATDMVSGHSTNYAPDADYTIVPTENARQEALRNGVDPARAFVMGQPVYPDLRQRMTHGTTARAALGFNNTLPMALLVGGGDGMGKMGEAAQAVAHSGLPLQLAVVCGRNTALCQSLDSMTAQMALKTLGFVTNVPELMGASDILITKAGSATMGEAFVAGLPMLIYDMVDGQEEGNVAYAVHEGAAAWCPTPQTLVNALRDLLTQPQRRHEMRAASARLARPDSALDIARFVARLCDEG